MNLYLWTQYSIIYFLFWPLGFPTLIFALIIWVVLYFLIRVLLRFTLASCWVLVGRIRLAAFNLITLIRAVIFAVVTVRRMRVFTVSVWWIRLAVTSITFRVMWTADTTGIAATKSSPSPISSSFLPIRVIFAARVLRLRTFTFAVWIIVIEA